MFLYNEIDYSLLWRKVTNWIHNLFDRPILLSSESYVDFDFHDYA